MVASLLATAVCAAERKLPEIPDPFGLGERLALIDYLHEKFGVEPPAGASMDELVAMYWQHDDSSKPQTDDDINARDRMQRMRSQLFNDFGVRAPEDLTESALADMLAKAKNTARAQAVDKVLERAAARENPESAEKAAEYAKVDRDNIQATIDRLGSDIRAERATIVSLEKKRAKNGEDIEAAVEKLDELTAAAQAAATEYAKAVEAYNNAVVTHVSTAESKKAMDQASAAKNDRVASHEAQVALIKRMQAQDEELARQRDLVVKRIEQLDARRVELLEDAAGLKQPSAGNERPAAMPVSESPAAVAPAADPSTLEGRLKSAVVLLFVEGRGSGTGFFVSADGLLVTNAHVIGEEHQPIIALWDASTNHQRVRMKEVKVLPDQDLALLRAESGTDFQTLQPLEVYDLSHPLLAVGFPLAGQFAHTLGTAPNDIVVSRGILGSVRRRGTEVEWLQHDCKIASGNSGGPIVDQNTGAVIGVNTMVMDPNANGGAGDSMSLAIPIKKVRDAFAGLIP